MKNVLIRIIPILLSIIMLTSILASCNTSDIDTVDYAQDYVYVAEFVTIPSDIGRIQHLVYYDDIVYFAATEFVLGNVENHFLSSNTASIYSMSCDGTNLSKLIFYTHYATVPIDTGGASLIEGIAVDNEGYLWIVESWSFYYFNLPEDFDITSDNPWEHHEIYDSGNIMRKLDTSGNELLSVDISSYVNQQEFQSISAFTVDNKGSIILATWDFNIKSSVIYVFDKLGNMQYQTSLQTQLPITQLIQMHDSSVAFISGTYYDSSFGIWVRELSRINTSSGALTETYTISIADWQDVESANGSQIYAGHSEHDILISDYSGLYGFSFGDNKAVELFSWIEINIIRHIIDSIIMLPDGRIVCINTILDSTAQEVCSEFIVLTKTLRSELPDITVLTLGTFGMSPNLENAVASFNRVNNDLHIEVIDYSGYIINDDTNTALTRITNEFIVGNAPDILDISGFSYIDFAKSGLLMDLYPLIDNDLDFNRSDFIQAAFRAVEVDGSLYQVFPEFYVSTIIANPSVAGSNSGWNIDEFRAVLNANPNADIPIGWHMSNIGFLIGSVVAGINDYISWETGTAHFDTHEFVCLLELCVRFPDIGRVTANYANAYIPSHIAIIEGRQFGIFTVINNFNSIQEYRRQLGGEIVLKGFPNEARNGHFIYPDGGLAITSNSLYKEEAWAFVRTLLDKDWQLNSLNIVNDFAFATNDAVFNQKLNNYSYSLESGTHHNEENATLQIQEDIDIIINLINSSQGEASRGVSEVLLDIIREDALNYFNGIKSAEDAARDIQSRVSIYISERS